MDAGHVDATHTDPDKSSQGPSGQPMKDCIGCAALRAPVGAVAEQPLSAPMLLMAPRLAVLVGYHPAPDTPPPRRLS